MLDLLAEPVAAALSYPSTSDRSRHLLIYDLGAGSFDVSVIRIDGTRSTVLATGGNVRLGGVDWDQRIATYLLDEFQRAHPGLGPSADDRFIGELHQLAENAKKALSQVSSRPVSLKFAGSVARVTLTRHLLESLTHDLLERTMTITAETIANAPGLRPDQIDEVLLVGGMTRMPAVAARLSERLGLDVVRVHEPDLAVVRGAALFARLRAQTPVRAEAAAAESLADQQSMRTRKAESMPRLIQVLPRALGVKVADENDPRLETDPANVQMKILHLIQANTPLPAVAGPFPVATVLDNQATVEIEVWEAKPGTESAELDDNVRIGRGTLHLPRDTPARSLLHLTFRISTAGLLTVTATDPRTGEELTLNLMVGADRADLR